MKFLKRILAVCSFCTILTATNCFAVTLNKTDVTDNSLNCYRTYLVQKEEQNSFIENIEQEIEVYGDKYVFDSYTAQNETTIDTIDINTTKKIISKTKNLDSIINQLGEKISYNQDEYVGEYILNTDNIQIKTNYGTKRYVVNTKEIIDETDFSYLEVTEDNRITLITCVAGQKEKRLCVQAIESLEGMNYGQ